MYIKSVNDEHYESSGLVGISNLKPNQSVKIFITQIAIQNTCVRIILAPRILSPGIEGTSTKN
jgi:hypothetical protein